VSTDVLTTVLLSVKVALIATVANLLPAIGVARLMSGRDYPGKSLVDGVINLPLVLPPVATGYLLLLILGRRGPVGSLFVSLFDVRIAYTTAAAVIAAMVVSFPLVTRSIRLAMEMIDRRVERAAQTLGAPATDVFLRVTLPLIAPGVVNGALLGFARSMGEFGATMVFAGNVEGRTRTIPLSVYSLLQVPGRDREAIVLLIVSVVISLGAMFASAALTRRVRRRSAAGGS
jgi:molybdate transport system permease protein